MSNCTFEMFSSKLFSVEQKCEFAQDCDFEYFNLISLNYCHMNGLNGITIVFAILILLLCFYFVSSTGDGYLAPCLGIISDKMGLSQNLAGLTLIAFGNQSADLIVAFVSSGDEEEGVAAALGALLGAGMFVLGIVLNTVLVLGGGVNVVSYNYVRDLLTYLVGIILVIVYGVFKAINVFEAALFLGLYISYIVLCYFMDKKMKQKVESLEDTQPLFKKEEDPKEFDIKMYNEEDEKLDGSKKENEILVDDDSKVTSLIDDDMQKKEELIKEEPALIPEKPEQSLQKKLVQPELNLLNYASKSYFSRKFKNIAKAFKTEESKKAEQILYSKFNYDLVRYYLSSEETTWSEKNIFQKIVFCVLAFPLNILRNLTIPAYEQQNWKRLMFVFHPIAIPTFLIAIFKQFTLFKDHPIIMICFYVVMIGVSVVFYYMTYRTALPRCHWVQLIVAFVISLLWLWAVINILVDMITVCQLLAPIDIPKAFLTLTIVAVGNSLDDFVVDCSLAKNGFGEMAVSGSIGGPCFGLLLGYGISLLHRMVIDKATSVEFIIFDFKNDDNALVILIALCCIILIVLGEIIGGFIMKFHLKQMFCIYGYTIYGLYVISVFIVAFFVKK